MKKNLGEELLGSNLMLATSCLHSLNAPSAICSLKCLLANPYVCVCCQVTENSFTIISAQSSELPESALAVAECKMWVSSSEHQLLLSDTSEHLQNMFCVECMSVAIATCHRKNCLPDCHQFRFQFSHAPDKLFIFWGKKKKKSSFCSYLFNSYIIFLKKKKSCFFFFNRLSVWD